MVDSRAFLVYESTNGRIVPHRFQQFNLIIPDLQMGGSHTLRINFLSMDQF